MPRTRLLVKYVESVESTLDRLHKGLNGLLGPQLSVRALKDEKAIGHPPLFMKNVLNAGSLGNGLFSVGIGKVMA